MCQRHGLGTVARALAWLLLAGILAGCGGGDSGTAQSVGVDPAASKRQQEMMEFMIKSKKASPKTKLPPAVGQP